MGEKLDGGRHGCAHMRVAENQKPRAEVRGFGFSGSCFGAVKATEGDRSAMSGGKQQPQQARLLPLGVSPQAGRSEGWQTAASLPDR